MDERMMDDHTMNDVEAETELSLRPHYLHQYIGQPKLKNNLEIFIPGGETPRGSIGSCPAIRPSRSR